MPRYLALLIFTLCAVYQPASSEQTGRIIYLNGPSSAGKSTLAKAIQAELPGQWMHIGIDTMISMMPDQLNDWTGGEAEDGFSWQLSHDAAGHRVAHLRMGPAAKRLQRTFEQVILTLVREGHDVIVDDVLYPRESFEKRQAALVDAKVIYVAVTAPLEELERREQARGDRFVGSVRGQLEQLPRGVGYDVELDSMAQSSQDMIAAIRGALDSL